MMFHKEEGTNIASRASLLCTFRDLLAYHFISMNSLLAVYRSLFELVSN